MTQRDSVSELIDRFAADLQRAEHQADRAAAPRRRRSVRRTLLAGAALAVAGTAVVLAVGVGGGSRLDVVSEARAALAPEGTILHMKIAGGRVGEPDDPNARELREVWTAENPKRWRYSQTMPVWTYHGGKGRMTDEQQTDEFAFAGGTSTELYGYPNTLTTTSGYGEHGPATTPITWPGMPPGQDPAEALRALLASGKLRSAGKTTLSGRPVLRIVGRTIADQQRGVPSQPVEYDVDATTFVPVRMLLTSVGPTTAGAPAVVALWFRVFERLPLTPENEAKLTVTPPPGAKVRRLKLPVKGQPCERDRSDVRFCKA